jgi:hypothetical protein
MYVYAHHVFLTFNNLCKMQRFEAATIGQPVAATGGPPVGHQRYAIWVRFC